MPHVNGNPRWLDVAQLGAEDPEIADRARSLVRTSVERSRAELGLPPHRPQVARLLCGHDARPGPSCSAVDEDGVDVCHVTTPVVEGPALMPTNVLA